LRTETAALAVITVLQYLYGDWTRLPQGQDEGRDVSG